MWSPPIPSHPSMCAGFWVFSKLQPPFSLLRKPSSIAKGVLAWTAIRMEASEVVCHGQTYFSWVTFRKILACPHREHLQWLHSMADGTSLCR